MNRREARWLADALAGVPDDELFPMVNLGSSTAWFRRVRQPYIHDTLFGPLERRGRVVYIDLKPAEGVDIVGDVTDPAFLSDVRTTVAPRAAVLSNVLEHVEDRTGLCRAVLDLLPAGGWLAVSGPHRYPHHPDPIDTMYRPTADEVAASFPGTSVVAVAHIDSGNWREWSVAERGRSLTRLLLRACMPYPRPAGWREALRQLPWVVRHNVAYAVLLRREPTPAATSDP